MLMDLTCYLRFLKMLAANAFVWIHYKCLHVCCIGIQVETLMSESWILKSILAFCWKIKPGRQSTTDVHCEKPMFLFIAVQK